MNIHDEIMYLGKPLIIDTTTIPYNGAIIHETMALRKGGEDLDTYRTASEEEARENHALLMDKYSGHENAPLTGKYAKLRDDLIAAYAETEYLEQTEDGGTCNFDAPVLRLDRWNAKKIKQAAEEAGSGAFRWTVGKTMLGWVFATKSSGQANRRTRRAEAISEALKAKGYDAGMYYAMD